MKFRLRIGIETRVSLAHGTVGAGAHDRVGFILDRYDLGAVGREAYEAADLFRPGDVDGETLRRTR